MLREARGLPGEQGSGIESASSERKAASRSTSPAQSGGPVARACVVQASVCLSSATKPLASLSHRLATLTPTSFSLAPHLHRHVQGRLVQLLLCHQQQLPARPAEGQVLAKGARPVAHASVPLLTCAPDLPSQRRSRGQRVPQHPARGLEARAQPQLRHGRPAVPLPRAQRRRPAEQGCVGVRHGTRERR